MRRPVKIILRRNVYFVSYQDRKRYGRHNAATFYAPNNTLEFVKNWVKQQPGLELVE